MIFFYFVFMDFPSLFDGMTFTSVGGIDLFFLCFNQFSFFSFGNDFYVVWRNVFLSPLILRSGFGFFVFDRKIAVDNTLGPPQPGRSRQQLKPRSRVEKFFDLFFMQATLCLIFGYLPFVASSS